MQRPLLLSVLLSAGMLASCSKQPSPNAAAAPATEYRVAGCFTGTYHSVRFTGASGQDRQEAYIQARCCITREDSGVVVRFDSLGLHWNLPQEIPATAESEKTYVADGDSLVRVQYRASGDSIFFMMIGADGLTHLSKEFAGKRE